ncbi:GNAT family N-acetyltransferase [Lactococcus garvieae]|nr:GNAT family N-acetyltransferase [Lactococcus garvieae]
MNDLEEKKLIREATVADAKHLSDITAEQLGYEVSAELLAKQLEKLTADKENHFIRVYGSAVPIGYIHAELYESIYSEPMFNILGLAVAKGHENQGVGKALLLELEREAKRRNLWGIRLNSSDKRRQAHEFYAHLGYHSDKSQKRFLKML